MNAKYEPNLKAADIAGLQYMSVNYEPSLKAADRVGFTVYEC